MARARAWAGAGSWLAAVLVASPWGAARAAAPEVPQLDVGGRVLARADLRSDNDYTRELSLGSARLSLDAKWKKFLRAAMAVDLTSSPMVTDAFVDLKLGKGFSVRGGRFKSPFSARNLSSAWQLPLVDRGILNDAIGGVGYGGRSLGLQLRYTTKKIWDLQIDLAVMRGQRPSQEDLVGRASIEPLSGLVLGLNGYGLRLGRTGLGMGADLTAHLWGNQFSVEYLNAATPPLQGAVDAENPVYSSRSQGVCGLLARRFYPGEERHLYLEPVVAAEAVVTKGLLPGLSQTAGLNVGFADGLRLQVHGTRRSQGSSPADLQFSTQVGGRF